jgi:hypothetical protein
LVYFDGKVDIRKPNATIVQLARRPVLHAIELCTTRDGGMPYILTADNLGVGMVNPISPGREDVIDYVAGAKGSAPKRGCSEIHLGRLKSGIRFVATLEPWHGNQAVVYLGTQGGSEAPNVPPRQYTRQVIDDTLADAHALWVADVDGDGDDEVFAGHRGKDHRVSMYDLDGATKTWTRTVLDRDIAAQDLRGGDLDADGVPDVVAVGGSTHNVVWYLFRRK